MKFEILFLLFSYGCFAQNTQFDTKAEFEKLFGGYWDAKSQEIIWTPNFEESLLFSEQMGQDGKCRTKYIKQIGIASDAFFLIFATYPAPEDYLTEVSKSCHLCGAPVSVAKYVFNSNTKKWKVAVFDKYITSEGFWGEPNHFDFIKIGEFSFLRETSNGDYNMGHFQKIITFYKESGGRFRKVFAYSSEQGNETFPVVGDEEGYENTTTLLTDNNRTVILETEGMELVVDFIGEPKLVSAKRRVIYKITDEGDFILQCD